MQPYDLPDAPLLKGNTAGYRHLVWRPAATVIVIGRSNQADTSVHLEKAAADGVPVMQRPTGGETVVLSPRMVAVSAVVPEGFGRPSVNWFRAFNEVIIRSLQKLGVSRLNQNGISDIAIGQRKILGSSMFRNREFLFYHAILNLSEPPETIECYLQTPRRMPEYRAGRPHREFVTSLAAEGYPLEPAELCVALAEALRLPPRPAPAVERETTRLESLLDF